MLQSVGSVGPDQHMILITDDDRKIGLNGARSLDFRHPIELPLCITGRKSVAIVLGGELTIDVVSYQIKGDGKRTPLIGVVSERRGKLFLTTNEGRRYRVTLSAKIAPARVLGHRIWALATPCGGTMHVEDFGTFD